MKQRTGSFEPVTLAGGTVKYRGRLRLDDGTKSERFDLPPDMNEKQARKYLALLQAEEDRTHTVASAKRARLAADAAKRGEACDGETCDAWHRRFLASRVGLERANYEDGHRWKKWISPTLGPLPIAQVSGEDVERVRDRLDEAIRAGTLRPKSAANVWTVLTTAFKAARTAKQRDLRVRTDNPCADVLPPERGEGRRKLWIYPNEFLALISCEQVPRVWRECYAIACYLYVRPNELHELRWSDVDLDARSVHVTRAWEAFSETVKRPKTAAGVRRVPIPHELVPLLERMKKGQPSTAKVVPCFEERDRSDGAELVRRHMKLAGVDRPELHDLKSRTHMAIGFRSWRDTGITWEAIRGTDLVKLQRRAGHVEPKITLGYVKEAEDRSALVGAVFPALPAELVAGAASTATPVAGSGPAAQDWPSARTSEPNPAAILVAPPGVEPPEAPAASALLEESDRPGSAKLADDPPKQTPVAQRLAQETMHSARPDLTHAIALAAAVEALASGHARTLAAELRAELEAVSGPRADVVSLDDHRRGKR